MQTLSTNFISIRNVFLITALPLMLFNCSGVTHHYKVNPNAIQKSISIIQMCGALDVVQIDDDEKYIKGNKAFHKETTVYLPPGEHFLVVRFKPGGGAYSSNKHFSVNLEPAQSYRLTYKASMWTKRIEYKFLKKEDYIKLREEDKSWK